MQGRDRQLVFEVFAVALMAPILSREVDGFARCLLLIPRRRRRASGGSMFVGGAGQTCQYSRGAQNGSGLPAQPLRPSAFAAWLIQPSFTREGYATFRGA